MIELELKDAQKILSALRIGTTSFLRDEGIEYYDAKTNRIKHNNSLLADPLSPTSCLLANLHFATEVIERKIKDEIEGGFKNRSELLDL